MPWFKLKNFYFISKIVYWGKMASSLNMPSKLLCLFSTKFGNLLRLQIGYCHFPTYHLTVAFACTKLKLNLRLYVI